MRGAAAFTLTPVRDVAIRGDRFEALGREPWLRVTPDEAFARGRIVEILYAAGPLDRVARPLLRFVLADGQARDMLMPAPAEGVAIWRGRVPAETVEVRISPTGRTETFSFAILSVRVLPFTTLLRFAATSPKRAFFVSGARLARLRAEADLNLGWMLGRAETQDFASWRAAREGVAPAVPSARASGFEIAIIVAARDSGVADVAATLESLRRQTFVGWRMILADPPPLVSDWAKDLHDPRVVADETSVAAKLPAGGLAAFLRAGDTLAPHGLASFAARFADEPALDLIYADELRMNGKTMRPVFKPDWSPTWQQFAPYVGRAAVFRTDLPGSDLSFNDDPEATINHVLAHLGNDRIGHLRRAVVTTRAAATVVAPSREKERDTATPAVGIVVPTRDRLDLLRPCIESVLRGTDYPDFRIVIADNGSVEPRTLRWLAEIAHESRVIIAPMPGPFNFADICNRAARLLDTSLLLFLNNDTGVLHPEWVRNLAEFAMRPDIGAVGAKLLHGDGRVQHAGVVLGLGGVAGHFGAGLREDEPGWLDGNSTPHEVSAVTGACLMVEARKFWEVGGFDAENLPVELNDIDLCLRLAERGWRTICDCRTRLLHREFGESRRRGLPPATRLCRRAALFRRALAARHPRRSLLQPASFIVFAAAGSLVIGVFAKDRARPALILAHLSRHMPRNRNQGRVG